MMPYQNDVKMTHFAGRHSSDPSPILSLILPQEKVRNQEWKEPLFSGLTSFSALWWPLDSPPFPLHMMAQLPTFSHLMFVSLTSLDLSGVCHKWTCVGICPYSPAIFVHSHFCCHLPFICFIYWCHSFICWASFDHFIASCNLKTQYPSEPVRLHEMFPSFSMAYKIPSTWLCTQQGSFKFKRIRIGRA